MLREEGNTGAAGGVISIRRDARAGRAALVCAAHESRPCDGSERACERVSQTARSVRSVTGPERGPSRRGGRAERRATWGGGSGADVRALRGRGVGGAGRGRRRAARAAAPAAPVPPRVAGQAGAPRPARPVAPPHQAQPSLSHIRVLRSVPLDHSTILR